MYAFKNMLPFSISTPTSFFSSTSSLADVLKELDDAYERYHRESDSLQRRKLQLSIQRALIRSQELGDEKIQIVGQMVRKEHPAAVTVKLFTGKLPGLNVCTHLRIEQCIPITFTLRKLNYEVLPFHKFEFY